MRKHGLPEEFEGRLSVTIIMDDLGAHPKIMGSRALKQLASTGRHILINAWILAQHIVQCPPAVRSQFDKVFMLRTANEKEIKCVHKEFLSMVSLTVFKAVLDVFTEKRGVLVIDTHAGGGNIDDVCKFAELLDADVRNTVVPLGKGTVQAHSGSFRKKTISRTNTSRTWLPARTGWT